MTDSPNPTGFTSKLRQTLIVSRSKLDEWVEHQKAAADAAASVQQAEISEQQTRIDQAVTHLLSLQLEHGFSVSCGDDDNYKSLSPDDDKRALLDKMENINQQIDELSQKLQDTEDGLEQLRLEHARHQERALEVRKLKQNAQVSKEATVEDLTRGIINYKYLGLDFEKAGDDVLR